MDESSRIQLHSMHQVMQAIDMLLRSAARQTALTLFSSGCAMDANEGR